MSSPFGQMYAGAYDAMYANKGYDSECDLLESAFRRYGPGAVSSVLDLGCGTGGHSLLLAARGYSVVGLDLSPEMLEQARMKADGASGEVRFLEGDLRDADLKETFDAVIMMFAVLGYQRSNADVRAALATARRHLHPGGVLFFDFWYGPGVLVSPPGSGERLVETPDGPIQRTVNGELDVRHQLCSVRYELRDQQSRTAVEEHVMRYFFPAELELFLEDTGFELKSLAPVGSLEGDPGVETWNANVVAVAAG